uniref:G-protein coupled receptors family 1 profile domain-containing protein n=1 Tax=Seriola lalandi dorsalis TaxID=1841481 RepID=A0A3B4YMZ3_SERLL
MSQTNQVSYFTLAAYFDTRHFKYLFFMILTSLYLLIICANVLLIVVICLNRSLHEPMYLFLCSLFVNELYGSTGLFPFRLLWEKSRNSPIKSVGSVLAPVPSLLS